jgi:hypothetical protein
MMGIGSSITNAITKAKTTADYPIGSFSRSILTRDVSTFDRTYEHAPVGDLNRITTKHAIPFMPKGAERDGEFKTNTVLLIQMSPMVIGIGKNNMIQEVDYNGNLVVDANGKPVMVARENANQTLFLENLAMGRLGKRVNLPKNTVFITYFAGGAKIRIPDKFDDAPKSVREIIKIDDLEGKTKAHLWSSPDLKDLALTILKRFKDDRPDVANTMRFVSWYYGMHVPKIVVTFNKGQRAVDMCDEHNTITHMIMKVAKTRGTDSVKQQAGRCKVPVGKLLQCNFPADFEPTIATNANLAAAAALENLPYDNEWHNGKRDVHPTCKETLRNNNVLDKACKKYEPKLSMLRAFGEVDEPENPANGPAAVDHNVIPEGYVLKLKDYTQGGKIGIYLYRNSDPLQTYTKKELLPICDRIANEPGFVGRWINDLHRLHVLTKHPDGTYSVNTHIPLVVKSKPPGR